MPNSNQMIEIVVDNENWKVDTERLIQAAQQVFVAETLPDDTALTVVISSDERVHELNQQFRGVDAPTDVLSFPADAAFSQTDDGYLGDIIIAYPYAKRQAEREAIDFEQSLCLLLVHGILHLIGYDHDTLENRRQMWERQDVVLSSLNIPLSIVPALESYLDNN